MCNFCVNGEGVPGVAVGLVMRPSRGDAAGGESRKGLWRLLVDLVVGLSQLTQEGFHGSRELWQPMAQREKIQSC